MNAYIEQQIVNAINQTVNFQKLCELAAMTDDNKISLEEKRVLSKIAKINDKYKKALKAVK